MMTFNINYAAVRAFNRVWNPRAAELGMAESADAGFDAGEFSGSFHADQWEREEQQALNRVGSRFGLTADQLWNMVMEADLYENYMLQNSDQ